MDHYIDLLEDVILCPPESRTRECIKEECADCGVSNLKEDYFDKWTTDENIKFDYRSIEKDEGAHLGVIEKTNKPPAEFIKHFEKHISGFALHRFLAKNQKAEINSLLDDLTPGSLVIISDYSEKHAIKEREEVQSLHWHSKLITILCCIAHFIAFDPTTQSYKKVKIYFVFLTERTEQDHFFVTHCHQIILNWLKENFNFLAIRIYKRSDRCGCQFCNRKVFGAIAESTRNFCVDHDESASVCSHCPQVILDFSAAGHGKNEVDHLGALIKFWLKEEERKGRVLRSLPAIDAHLMTRNFVDLSYTALGKEDNRGYFYSGLCTKAIQAKDVATPNRDWERIERTRDLHQLITTKTPGELLVRESSCFSCESCKLFDFNNCQRTEELGPLFRTEVSRVATTDATIRAATLTRAAQENYRNRMADLAQIGSVIAITNVSKQNQPELAFVLVTGALGGNNSDELQGKVLKKCSSSRNKLSVKGVKPTTFLASAVRSPPLPFVVNKTVYEIDIDEFENLVNSL